MDRTEWMRRYAARIKSQLQCSEGEAKELAEAGVWVYDEDPEEPESPENAADEELSYWTDDEGGTQ